MTVSRIEFTPENMNELSSPGELYIYSKKLYERKERTGEYPPILMIQGFLSMKKISGLSTYRCPVCGVKFMNGMEVLRIDHFNEDHSKFYSQLLHISCAEKILSMGKKAAKGKRHSDYWESDQVLILWSILGRRNRGESWESLLPHSIVRTYVELRERGEVKSVDDFLGIKK